MAGALNYVFAAVQFVAGVILTAVGAGQIGVPLMLAGVTSAAATALAPRYSGSSLKNSPTYGFDRGANVAAEGSPVPIVLGQMRTFPTLISLRTTQSGKKQTISAVFLVAAGGDYGIEAIEDIELNDQPLAHFGDVTATTRLGTSTQTAMSGFEQTSVPWEDGTEFDEDVVWTYTTHRAVDEVQLVLAWYGGLFGIKGSGSDKGSLEETGWRALVEYQDDGSTTWTKIDPPQGEHDGWKKMGNGEWKVLDKTRAVLRMVMTLTFSTTAIRTIRVKALNGNDSSNTRNPTLLRVEEVVDDARTYAGYALLGIKALAGAQLAAGLPRVSCLVSGWKVLNMGDSSAAWTRNPAKLLRTLFADTANGFGAWFESADIADGSGESWRVARDYYDAVAAASGDHNEARHQLDLVIDAIQPGGEWLDHILALCRSSLVEYEGQIHLLVDKAATSSATFDARQARSSANRPVLSLADGRADIVEQEIEGDRRVTHVKSEYWDRDDSFRRTWTAEVVDPDWTSTDPIIRQELYLPGVTRGSEAIRQARFALQRSRLRPRVVQIGIGPGDFDLLPFDVVTLYADSPYENGSTWQVAGIEYASNHAGRLTLVPYDANIYTDTTDAAPSTTTSQNQANSTSVTKDATTSAGSATVSLQVTNR